MSEKISFHIRGEKEVKGRIRDSDNQYEIVGREQDPRVAEAMAYAAKPLIDDTLEALTLEPNNEGMATFIVDGETVLNKTPGVVTPYGTEVSYREMATNVAKAHDAANTVQVGYYDRVTAAKKALDEAKSDI